MARGKGPNNVLEALTDAKQKGKPTPQPHPSELPMGRIKLMPGLFQHRRITEGVSRDHSRTLARVLSEGRHLEPITVWWSGRQWVCVDGHHRLTAYRTKGSAAQTQAVPVRVFEGSPLEAAAEAAGCNTRDQLPMSETEKMNAAWRLVALDGDGVLSKAKTAEKAGVAARSVANMRTVRAQLVTKGHDPWGLAEFTWHQARAEARGSGGEWSPEEHENRVAKVAEALRRAVGPLPDKAPDVLIEALRMAYPRVAALMVQEGAEQTE